MTDYIYRITAACPESMLDDANQLAGCLGEQMADVGTYRTPRYEDAAGNIYSVMSTVVTQFCIDAGTAGNVMRPKFDNDDELDLDAAQQAVNVMLVSFDEESTPAASPGALVAVVNVPPHDAIAAMGLTLIETTDS